MFDENRFKESDIYRSNLSESLTILEDCGAEGCGRHQLGGGAAEPAGAREDCAPASPVVRTKAAPKLIAEKAFAARAMFWRCARLVKRGSGANARIANDMVEFSRGTQKDR